MKWFKKKQRPLPEDTICRNCGTQTIGRYCHECGQDINAGTGQSTLKLTEQALESAFALDGKTPRTLAFLMVRPGFLSEEYRKGKINRYIHPVRLFWMATLVFFALLISQLNSNEVLKSPIYYSTENGLTISLNEPSDSTTTMSQNMDEGESYKKMDEKDWSMMVNYIAKFAPYVTFLLIPIFAFLLILFFWRTKCYYMYQMVFTLHFHTFLWIFFSLNLLVDIFTRNWTYPTWLNTLLFFLPGVYLIVALRRYYQTKSWWQATWKAVLISLLYAILIIMVTACIVAVVIKIYFP